MQSDVWRLSTCIDDDDTSCMMVQQDQNNWNTIQDQNQIFFFQTMNNEQWKEKESNKTNVIALIDKCDCRTNNYNPVWPGINSEISHATEGLCAYLKK